MGSKSDQVKKLIDASFLNNRTKRSYLQTYQLKLKNFGERKVSAPKNYIYFIFALVINLLRLFLSIQ